MTIEEHDKVVKCKRSNNILSTTKLHGLYPNIKSIKESVVDCLKKYNNDSIKISLINAIDPCQ